MSLIVDYAAATSPLTLVLRLELTYDQSTLLVFLLGPVTADTTRKRRRKPPDSSR